MKYTLSFVLTLVLLFLSSIIFSQSSENKFWSPVNESSIHIKGLRQIVPQKFLTFSLKEKELKDVLYSAPDEKTGIDRSASIIYLPLPNGTLQRFKVVNCPIMAPELASVFPDIKTFSVKGIDDPYANGKLDWNEFGFHGMILSIHGDFFIDPYCIGNASDYMSYYTADFVKDPSHIIPEASFEEADHKKDGKIPEDKTGYKPSSPPAICVGAQLRTYRLAVACTGEYAKAATGSSGTVIPTVAQTLAKIVTTVNRVNGVYEKEVSVRLVLVPTETLVIFTNPATDPFNGNNNANTLINESQTVITNTIGVSNFDIGHTFSTGAGGLAFLGAVCVNSNKARGITGSPNPVGDPYDIDYVAHEVGHQFSGNHTFNAITGNCNGNRAGSTSVEPGSGVTIMGYAGLCSVNNVANNSIAYFHAISYDEIVNFTNSGAGNNCPVTTTTGNNPPVVTGAGSYIVPKSTPFILTGSATDVNGDVLTYSWEETDAGTTGANWNSGSRPFFRSYIPVASPTRLFPRNSSVLTGNYTVTIGEFLPTTSQSLNFRLTARDNKMGGGGVCYASSNITVDASGPLLVNYPSAAGISWFIGTPQTVTWDINGTDVAPVNCDTVKLLISYDAGSTYSVILNSTPNDGIQTITAPTLSATINTCRIKVESKGNIFYDISNNNFAITTNSTAIDVGIKQLSQNNPVGLSVWPNPFSNQINLVVGSLNNKANTLVSVVDLLGKTVLQYTYSGKSELKETLDLTALSNGVYFIKVSNDNNQSIKRVVKD